MNYSVLILRRAQNELAALPLEAYEKLKAAILALSVQPRPPGCKKLSGRDGWRIRVGNFRAIYEIDDEAKKVLILHIGHRSDVYR